MMNKSTSSEASSQGSPEAPIRGEPEDTHEEEEEEAGGIPLHTPWTFWIDKSIRGTSAAECEANLKKLPTVKTIQAFWRVNNNLPKPSMMNPRYSYHLLRNENRPIWEDDSNCRGGCWRMKCQKHFTDEVWQELQLAVIGEQFGEFVAPGDDVIGLSVGIRDREDVVQLWTKDSSLSEPSSSVLQKVQQLLPNVPHMSTFYKAFNTHEAFEGKK